MYEGQDNADYLCAAPYEKQEAVPERKAVKPKTLAELALEGGDERLAAEVREFRAHNGE